MNVIDHCSIKLTYRIAWGIVRSPLMGKLSDRGGVSNPPRHFRVRLQTSAWPNYPADLFVSPFMLDYSRLFTFRGE